MSVQHQLPIDRADSDELTSEFLKHWSPSSLAKKGLHQAIRDIMFDLQDHGDVILLKVDELHELTEWLVDNGIGMDVFNEDCQLSPELQSAVKKLLFAHGRCWGMTNTDMGIEEPDGQQ